MSQFFDLGETMGRNVTGKTAALSPPEFPRDDSIIE